MDALTTLNKLMGVRMRGDEKGTAVSSTVVSEVSPQSFTAETFNTFSHFFGAIAAVAGLVILIWKAVSAADLWKVLSFSVYGLTLVFVYTCSTIYHGSSGDLRKLFSRLDHQAIYLLIAGTYTPFTLVTLHGAWGWSIFGFVWLGALTGVTLEFLWHERYKVLPIVLYLVMGWVIVIAIEPLLQLLPWPGFLLLLSGGLCYTVGVIFYALGKKISCCHGIWHLLVMAGSVTHYCSVFLYVA